MARRKRLTPPQAGDLAEAPAPETKSMFPMGVARHAAPVAHQAGDAAAAAALQEVTEALRSAREEGRLLQRLPLSAVEAGYLLRDRIALDENEMAVLAESLRARGQQTPIDVVMLGDGRFGLVSGLRRLTALKRLHEETGADGFATVLARVRPPETAAEAYVAMVEENEIRVGLSYYERARVAARAAAAGVFATEAEALRGLFAAASRARRSKIGSFLTIYHALDGALAFPEALAERQGLALAKALAADPELGPRLKERLRKSAPADAAAEQAVLMRALVPERPAKAPPARQELAPGLWAEAGGTAKNPRLTLSGPKLDAAFRARLEAWLREQG